MFQRIVLAVDGSDRDARAVSAAAALADKAGGSVTVLHVVEKEPDGEPPHDADGSLRGDHVVEDALRALADVGVEAVARSTPTQSGGIGVAVVDVAHEEDADTIVVGSRGLTDAKALLLGSVTHDVVHFFRGCIVVAR
jgi:nucleotide-binding universal stress UspA family protein